MKISKKLFSLAIGALMAIGAAVGMKQTAERVNAERSSYQIDFKDSGSDSDGTDAKTEKNDLVSDGGDYISAVSATKVYQAKKGYGIKIGASSNQGKLTLNWNVNDYSVKPSSIVFNICLYDPDKSVLISVNEGTTQEYSPTDSFADYSYDMDGNTPLTSIDIKAKNASKNRFYLKSITINFDAGEPEDENITAFKGLETVAQLSFTYTATPGEETYFERYTGTITEGDYLICSGTTAMKNTILSSRFTYDTLTFVEDKIDSNSVDSGFVWHIANSGDYWTIYNATVKKYAAGTGANNKAQLLESGTDNKSLWTVSSSSGAFEFVNKQNKTNNVNANLRYNTNYGFACYSTSTGSALTLYKLGDSVVYSINQENNKNLISLNFGAYFNASLKKNLDSIGATEYGIAYKYDGSDLYNYTEMTGAFVVEAKSSTAINETLKEAVDNKHLFQFRLKLSGIPAENFDVAITAKAYVKIGADYYFMKEKTHSVNSIASAYLASGDTSISQYEGVLKWLSTYTGD